MITSIHHESKVYNRISDKRNFLSKVYFQRNVNGVTSDFFEKVSFNLRISSLLEDIKRAPKGSMFLRWNIEKLESWPRWSRTVAGTICSFSCRHVWQFMSSASCVYAWSSTLTSARCQSCLLIGNSFPNSKSLYQMYL